MKIVWLKYSFFLIFLGVFLLSMACNRNRYDGTKEIEEIKISDQISTLPIDSKHSVDTSQTVTIKRKGIKLPRKLALIVAISKYPPENGWLPTHASNDVQLIKSALASQGFDTLHHVKVLQDEKATKAGIISAIKEELIQAANPGDKAVFHFSGHGQQVFDVSGDELDQYDESLVPYEAPLFTTGDYRGESHLIDDELNLLFNQLRQRLGSQGSLLVTLDACYSGTATRSKKHGFYRGTNYKILPSDVSNRLAGTYDADDSWNLSALNETDSALSPIIVLSASQANQINHEIEIKPEVYVGSLSFALNQSLQNFPAYSSYRALYNNIVYHITTKVPDQQPYAEGMLDYQIFSANPQASPQYFNLIGQLNDKSLIIQGNLFNGIENGDEVHLYRAHTTDTSANQYLNKGKVVYSDFWQSKIVMQEAMKLSGLSDYWVIPNGIKLKDYQVKVTGNYKAINRLKDDLARQKAVGVSETFYDALLDININGSNYQITLQDEHHKETIMQSFASEQLMKDYILNKIGDQIKRINKVTQLRRLNIEDPDLKIDFEVLPVWVKKDMNGNPVFKDYRNMESANSKILQFNDQDYFKLKVVNKSDFPVYFSIFDIYANHEVSQLYPVNAKSLKAYVINANQEMEIPYLYYATKPYGLDYLKLVASDQPFVKMSNFTAETPGFMEDILPMIKLEKVNDPVDLAQNLTIKTKIYETLKPGI